MKTGDMRIWRIAAGGILTGQVRACAAIFNALEVPMSGHSKWATIKHKKGALDAKRGKIFTRLIKEITVAAKGGGDPDGNPRLRTAIAAAKAENMPQENIKRAIQRGTGELEGVNYEEIIFEGYGPGGVAIIVDVMTDNRNRAVSEIRHAFSKNGGNLGESGSVRFMFAKKGLIAVEKSAASEEQLMDIVLEHGGEDLNDEGDTWEIITDPAAYEAVAGGGEGGGDSDGDERSDHGGLDLHQAGRHGGKPDGAPAGGSGRLRRHAERLLELRYGCRADGTRGRLSGLEAGRRRPPGCGGLFLLKQGTRGRGTQRHRGLAERIFGLRIEGWGRVLRQVQGIVLLLMLAGTVMVAAEAPDGATANGEDASSPVAQVRNERSWEYGRL